MCSSDLSLTRESVCVCAFTKNLKAAIFLFFLLHFNYLQSSFSISSRDKPTDKAVGLQLFPSTAMKGQDC